MRRREILREARRNLTTGTSRAPLLAWVFLLVVGGLAVVDARAVIQVSQTIVDWRADGGSIVILTADDSVDARACDALSTVDGITAAGAIREDPEGLQLPVLPTVPPSLWESTPGFARLVQSVDHTGEVTAGSTGGRAGVLLSAALADTLGRAPGGRIATADGALEVSGVFPMPENAGQVTPLGHAALAPVPASGAFDACWVDIWPADQTTEALIHTTLITTGSDTPAQLARLNPTVAATIDPLGLYADRATRLAPAAACILAAMLAFAAARARRVEVASALHAGVRPGVLTAQHLAECATWLLAAAVLALPFTLWAATTGNPAPAVPVLADQWWTIFAGASGALLGTIGGIAATRENHLFIYFRVR